MRFSKVITLMAFAIAMAGTIRAEACSDSGAYALLQNAIRSPGHGNQDLRVTGRVQTSQPGVQRYLFSYIDEVRKPGSLVVGEISIGSDDCRLSSFTVTQVQPPSSRRVRTNACSSEQVRGLLDVPMGFDVLISPPEVSRGRSPVASYFYALRTNPEESASFIGEVAARIQTNGCQSARPDTRAATVNIDNVTYDNRGNLVPAILQNGVEP